MDDVFFRLRQFADILVDLSLQLNDGKDGVLHAVEISRLTSGHIRISRGCPCGHLLHLALYPLVNAERLGKVLLHFRLLLVHRHYLRKRNCFPRICLD